MMASRSLGLSAVVALLVACSASSPAPDRPEGPNGKESSALLACQEARSLRARVPQLLGEGRLDRAVRVIEKADRLCATDAPQTWAPLISTLAELGRTEEARALARSVIASERADASAKAGAARVLLPQPPEREDSLEDLVWRATSMGPALQAAARHRARDLALARAEVELGGSAMVELPFGSVEPKNVSLARVLLAVAPHGRQAALAHGRRVVIIDLAGWREVALHEYASAEIEELAYNGTGFRGSGLVTFARDGSVEVRSQPSCEGAVCATVELSVPAQRPADYSYRPLALSADGRLLAWAENRAVKVWDAEGRKLVATVPTEEEVRAVALDPKGTLLFVDTTTWAAYDLTAQRQILVVSHFAASEDGALVALLGGPPGAEGELSLHVWDAEQRTLRRAQLETEGMPDGVAFSATGRRIAVGSTYAQMYVVDARTLRLQRTLRDRADSEEEEGQFSPVWGGDDRTLLGDTHFGSYVAFDALTGRKLLDVARSVQEAQVYLGRSAGASVVVLEPGANHTQLEALARKDKNLARALRESSDPNTGSGWLVALGFLSGGALRKAVAFPGAEVVYALSPGEKSGDHQALSIELRLLSSQKRVVGGTSDGVLALFDIATGELKQRLSGKLDPKVVGYGISWAAHGRWLMASSGDDLRQVWDSSTGELVFQRPTPVDAIRWLGTDRSIQLRVRSSDAIARYGMKSLALEPLPDQPTSGDLAMSSDDFATSFDGTVRAQSSSNGVHIMLAGRAARNLKSSTPGPGVLALSDTERAAAADAQGRIHTYDVARDRRLTTFQLHRGKPLGVAFSSDGRLVASCSKDDLFVWSAERAEVLWSLERPDACGLLSVSPGGDCVAAGAARDVTLWQRGRRVQRVDDGGGLLRAMAFHPTGAFLAAGFEDGVVRLWRPSDGKLVARLLRLGEGAVIQGPGGHFDVLGDESAARGLGCRVKARVFPIELCEDRYDVPGLLERVLANDASYVEP